MQHIWFDEFLDVSPFCAFGGNNNNNVSAFQPLFAKNKSDASNNNNNNDDDNDYRKNIHSNTESSTSSLKKPILYRLASVIEHQGNAFGGHYICFRRLPTGLEKSISSAAGVGVGGSWYLCSDDVVQQVTWNRVRQAQAYMLFYEAV